VWLHYVCGFGNLRSSIILDSCSLVVIVVWILSIILGVSHVVEVFIVCVVSVHGEV